MPQQISSSNSRWQTLYLQRKPVFAAVINNLEVSPSMQSFKSSQLAARLSPLHSQSVIGATCRPPITASPSDHYGLLALLMQQLEESWSATLHISCVTSWSNLSNISAPPHILFLWGLFVLSPAHLKIVGGNTDCMVPFLSCRDLSLREGCSLWTFVASHEAEYLMS